MKVLKKSYIGTNSIEAYGCLGCQSDCLSACDNSRNNPSFAGKKSSKSKSKGSSKKGFTK